MMTVFAMNTGLPIGTLRRVSVPFSRMLQWFSD